MSEEYAEPNTPLDYLKSMALFYGIESICCEKETDMHYVREYFEDHSPHLQNA